jgi:hypothetical protein
VHHPNLPMDTLLMVLALHNNDLLSNWFRQKLSVDQIPQNECFRTK